MAEDVLQAVGQLEAANKKRSEDGRKRRTTVTKPAWTNSIFGVAYSTGSVLQFHFSPTKIYVIKEHLEGVDIVQPELHIGVHDQFGQPQNLAAEVERIAEPRLLALLIANRTQKHTL